MARSYRARSLLAVVVVVAIAASTEASAQTSVLIESVVGATAAGSDSEPLAPVLGEPRALSGRALTMEIERRLGARPGKLTTQQLSDLLARYARTEEALFYRGSQARAAIPDLEQMLTQIRGAQATRAHNPSARQMHRSALLGLARAYLQTHEDGKLDALFAELLACFPDQPIDAQRDGRQVAQLFEQFSAQSRERVKHGTLEIALRGRGTVYLNARPIGVDRLTVVEGTYELFVAGPNGDGRLRRVEVKAGTPARVVLDLDLELALEAEMENAVTLRFVDEASRRRSELELAEELRELLDVTELYVFRRRDNDAPVLVRVAAEGTATRTLPTTNTNGAWLTAAHELRAQNLTGGKIETAIDELTQPRDTQPPRWHRTARVIGFATYAIGAALLGAGLIADALNHTGSCGSGHALCPSSYQTGAAGPALAGVGGGLALIAASSLVATDGLDRKGARPWRTLGIVLLGAAVPALVGGGLYLHIASSKTRDPGTGDVVAPAGKRGNGIGAIAVGSGLALGGIAMMVADALRKPVAPIVGASGAGMFIGAAGRF